MAPPIRILVASSAVFDRQALRVMFHDVPDCTIIATCATGRELLEQLALVPDIVVMDFTFSDMDGSEALRELRKREATTPVIVFAENPASDWQARAIRAGANACVARVDATGKRLERAERELLAKVRLCRMETRNISVPPRRSTLPRPRPRGRVELVVIGTSTGGPGALPQVLSKLPSSFSVPIVIVQHMPSEFFTESLTKSLASVCALPVKHATQGEMIAGPGVWIAPGNKHLHLFRAGRGVRADLQDGPPLHGVRPAVDLLFQSAAEARGAGVLGIILTGMGRDGLSGSEAIVNAGGSLIAQDEATSVVWGMPGAVTDAGLTSAVLPISQIAGEIVSRVTQSARASA